MNRCMEPEGIRLALSSHPLPSFIGQRMPRPLPGMCLHDLALPRIFSLVPSVLGGLPACLFFVAHCRGSRVHSSSLRAFFFPLPCVQWHLCFASSPLHVLMVSVVPSGPAGDGFKRVLLALVLSWLPGSCCSSSSGRVGRRIRLLHEQLRLPSATSASSWPFERPRLR